MSNIPELNGPYNGGHIIEIDDRLKTLYRQLMCAVEQGLNDVDWPNPYIRLQLVLPCIYEALQNAKDIQTIFYDLMSNNFHDGSVMVETAEVAIPPPQQEIVTHAPVQVTATPMQVIAAALSIPAPQPVVEIPKQEQHVVVPDVPNVPEVPNVPDVPEVPEAAPDAPEVHTSSIPVEIVRLTGKETKKNYASMAAKTPRPSKTENRTSPSTQKGTFNEKENRFDVSALELDPEVISIYSDGGLTFNQKLAAHHAYKKSKIGTKYSNIVDIEDVCNYAISELSRYATFRQFTHPNSYVKIKPGGIQYFYPKRKYPNGEVQDAHTIVETHTLDSLRQELTEFAFQNEYNLYYGSKFINIIMSLLYMIRENIDASQVGTGQANELTNTLSHMKIMDTVIMIVNIASIKSWARAQIIRFVNCIVTNSDDMPTGKYAGMRICADDWY